MGNCCHNLYFFQEDDPPANFDEIIEEYKRKHPKPSQSQSLSMETIDSTEIKNKDKENKDRENNKERENKDNKDNKERENPYMSEPGMAIQIFPPIRRQYCIQLKD